MNKFTRVLAVAGITGAMAIGGAGVAQASTDHGQQVSPDKAQSAKRHDRNSRDKGKSRSGRDKGKSRSGRDKGKGRDKGQHKNDHKSGRR